MAPAITKREDGLTRLVRHGEQPVLTGRNRQEEFYRNLAALGKQDPFVFMKIILGYDWLEEYHYQWTRYYLHYRKRNMVRLFSRGTGKSTVHTIGFALWEAVNNPKVRQIIVNNREKNSIAFLRTIRQHIKFNTRFRLCYPYLKLAKDDQTEILFTLAEKDPRPEPSIAAIGVRGNLVSSHWDIMHLDDIVCDKDMLSEDIRNGTKVWFEAAQSLLNVGGWFSITGTPWHLDDLYAKLRDDNDGLPEEQRFTFKVKGALNGDSSLAYPTVYPQDKLEVLRKNMGVGLYNSQILCNPQPSETQIFSYSTIPFFDHKTNKNFYNAFYMYLDPATGKRDKGKNLSAMDYSALILGGISGEGTLDIHRAGLLRAKPSAICHLIVEMQKEYHCDGVLIEANGFQALIADELNRIATAKGVGIKIFLVTNTTSKVARISSMEPLWLRGDLRLRDDITTFKDPLFGYEMAYKEFMDQVVGWPVAAHDDAPDAFTGLCRGVRFLHFSESVEEQLQQTTGKGGIDAKTIISLRHALGN